MDNRRRPQTPTRPPEYMVPPYDEEPETSPTNAAAMRLLTSTDEYDPNSMRRNQAYVEPLSAQVTSPKEPATKPDHEQVASGEAGLKEAGLEVIPEENEPELLPEEAGSETVPDAESQPSGRPCGIPAKSSSAKLAVDDHPTEVSQDSNDGACASAGASENQKSSSHSEIDGDMNDCESIPESCKVAPLRVPAIKLKKPVLAPQPAHEAYIAHSPEKKYDPAVASEPLLTTGSPRKSASRLSKLSNFAKSASLKLKKKASFPAPGLSSRSRHRDSPPTYDSVPLPIPPRHRFTAPTTAAPVSPAHAHFESAHLHPAPAQVAPFEPVFANPAPAEFASASSVPDPFVSPTRMDGNSQWPRFAPRPVTCESLADSEHYQAQTWTEMPQIAEGDVIMPPEEAMFLPGQHNMRFPQDNVDKFLPVLPEGSSPRRREHQRMIQSQEQNPDMNLGRDKVQTQEYVQGELMRPSSRASAFSQKRPTSRASTGRLHPTIRASASDDRPISRASTSHVPSNNNVNNNNNNDNRPGLQYIRPTSRTSVFSHMIPPPVITIPTYSHSQEGASSRQTGHSYQPSITSTRSRRSSIMDPPIMAPPDSTYVPFQGRDLGSDVSYSSPSRPWSPQRMGTYSRPPSNMRYEPSDINGSPRPGTPSSRYGGSPRRPLPPQPMYPATSDISVSMPLHDHEEELHDEYDEDYFESDIQSESQFFNPPGHHARYDSQETLSGLEHGYDPDKNFGPAPVEGKHERRGVRAPQMSRKEVQLINGELVLECKIPTILYSFLPRRDEVEFTHMRYTAVTCDPDDFVERGYKLRQNIGRTARETELFICVTMYNENEFDFTRTMYAVMKNISHFCSRTKSRTWGENGWQKIVVCIVSDGRTKIHPRTLDALAAMGIYQDGIAKNFVNQKAVQAHVYEYTTQVSLDSDLKFKGAEKGIVPCQMIFCLKEKNQRKLNSHRWFFNAFGKALNPNVCILLDVGTRPGGNSLYYLWKAFDNDSNVAGACGEIKAMKGRFGGNLLNPLVASQNFEYKMSNILDKPLESVFGYITVLPGALSAYRYHALQNDETSHGPLSQYFKGETLHGQHADVFTANMYLAEDRILCWELVAKRGERWVLKYVRGCTGETDVPDSVPEFISQRRRWLNGAFFAAVYSLVHFKQIWSTDHTFARKVLLHIEFVYQFIQLIFTYFSLANFYLTFYFVAGGIADDKIDPFGHHIAKYIFIILRYTCVLLIATQFILSLGNRPQGAKKLYFASMVLYSIIMMYTSFACIYIVVYQFTGGSGADVSIGSNVFTNLIISTASTIGLYIIMSLIYLDPWHLITSAGQYFMLLPSYICTLQIYAFCNTHDVTWGTKGDNVMKTDLGGAVGKGSGSTVELEMPSEQLDIDSGYDEALRNLRDRLAVAEAPPSESQLQEDYYKSVRTYMVMLWMIANAILAMAVSEAYGGSHIGSNFYLRFILWSVASLALFRAIGSSAFAFINVVNMAVEGRVRLRLKAPVFGRSTTPTAGGWKPGRWTDRITDPLKELVNKIRRR